MWMQTAGEQVTELLVLSFLFWDFVIFKKEEPLFLVTGFHSALHFLSFQVFIFCALSYFSPSLSLLPPGCALFLPPWSLHAPRLSRLWPPLFIVPSLLSFLSSCPPFIFILSLFFVCFFRPATLCLCFLMHFLSLIILTISPAYLLSLSQSNQYPSEQTVLWLIQWVTNALKLPKCLKITSLLGNFRLYHKSFNNRAATWHIFWL